MSKNGINANLNSKREIEAVKFPGTLEKEYADQSKLFINFSLKVERETERFEDILSDMIKERCGFLEYIKERKLSKLNESFAVMDLLLKAGILKGVRK